MKGVGGDRLARSLASSLTLFRPTLGGAGGELRAPPTADMTYCATSEIKRTEPKSSASLFKITQLQPVFFVVALLSSLQVLASIITRTCSLTFPLAEIRKCDHRPQITAIYPSSGN